MDLILRSESILLLFALYMLYTLLPMIPTITIYRLFPDTTVALTGPLANLSVKATGAFAAYVVTVVLGWSLVSNISNMIEKRELVTWTIIGELKLVDPSGQPINDPERAKLIEDLDVTLSPPHFRPTEDKIVVHATLNERDPHTLTYQIPSFGSITKTPSPENSTWVYAEHKVTFSKPIEIRAWPRSEPYGKVGLEENYQQPLPEGGDRHERPSRVP